MTRVSDKVGDDQLVRAKSERLGSELQQERTLIAGVREELQRLRDSLTPERPVRVFSYLLFPQMRGVGQMELSGKPAGGPAEFISSAFRVMLQ